MDPTKSSFSDIPSIPDLPADSLEGEFDKFSNVAQKALADLMERSSQHDLDEKVRVYQNVKKFENLTYGCANNLRPLSRQAADKASSLYANLGASQQKIIQNILKDFETLLSAYADSPPSCETKNYLREEIFNFLKIDLYYEGRVERLADIRSLLNRFSIAELQLTGLSIESIMHLWMENPALLEKTVKADIPFKQLTPNSETEVFLDLALDLPKNARPMIHEILENVYSKRSGPETETIKPLIEHFRAHLKNHPDPEKFIGQLEKLMGLWLFQAKTFDSKILLPLSEGKFDQILEAMDKIESLEDPAALEKALEQFGSPQDVDWKGDLLKQLDAMKFGKQDFEKWFLRLIETERPRDPPFKANFEDCLNELQAAPDWLPSFMDNLNQLASAPPQFVDEVLALLHKMPFRAYEIMNFVEKADFVAKNRFEQLVFNEIGLAAQLITQDLEPEAQGDFLLFRDRLETVFGVEKGDQLWAKMLKTKLSPNFISTITSCTDDELRFYEPLIGRADLNYFISANDIQLLKTPKARQFYYDVLSKAHEFTRLQFFSTLRQKPEILEKLLPFSSVKAVFYLRRELAEQTPTSILLSLIDANVPVSLIEKICDLVPRYEELPLSLLQKLTDYFSNFKDISKRDSVITHTSQLLVVDLARVADEALVIGVLECLQDPNKEKHALMALKLMDQGKYEALPALLEISEDKLEEFVEKFSLPVNKAITSTTQGDFVFSSQVQGERAKLQAAIEIAEALILEDGSLDTQHIGKINVLKAESLSVNDRNSMQFKLDVLSRDSYFGARLANVTKVPPKGSEMYALLQKVMGKEEITLRDVRVALLSGLLWPTRQGQIGSCFSTSIVIQGESYPAGLRQTLEDLAGIIENSKLTRGKGGTVTQDYPVFAHDLLTEKSFANDHLLCRAREFTIASLGASPTDMDITVMKLVAPLMGGIQNFDRLFAADIKPIFYNEAGKRVKSVYLPTKLNPVNGDLGAWCLYDAEKNELIDDWQKYTSFLKELTAKVKDIYCLQHPGRAEQAAKILEGPGGVTAFIDSFQFISQQKFSMSSLQKMNPFRYKDSRFGPWIQYGGGGNTKALLQAFFGTTLPNNLNASIAELSTYERLKWILDAMIELPQPLRQLGEAFPGFKVPISSNTEFEGHGSHAYSLEPHAVLKLAKEKNSDAIIAHWLEQSKDLKKQALDPVLVGQILDNMKKSDSGIYTTFVHALTDPDLLNAKSVGELWNKIQQRGEELGFRPRNMFNLDGLFVAALAQTGLKEKIPMLKLGDTNWEAITDLRCYYSFYNDEMVFGFTGADAARIEPFSPEWVNMNQKMTYHHDFNLVKGG